MEHTKILKYRSIDEILEMLFSSPFGLLSSYTGIKLSTQ